MNPTEPVHKATEPKPVSTGSGTIGTPHKLNPFAKLSKRKQLLFTGIAAGVILAVGVGVFGLYLPSRPDAVFSRGLDRTGTAIERLTDAASKPETQTKYKNLVYNGKVSVKSDSIGEVLAAIDGKSNTKALQLNVSAEVNQPGTTAHTYKGSIIGAPKAGQSIPALYLQLTGLKDSPFASILPSAGQLEGKWLELKQPAASGSTTKSADITAEDVATLAKSINDLARDNIFTSDADKSILVNQAYLGKQDIDGTSTHHYRVGVNKARAKQFCTPLINTVYDSQVIKKSFNGNETALKQEKTNYLQLCQKQADSYKSSDSVEMWIGGKYDLIRQVRIYKGDSKKDYMDIGQTYKGGAAVPLYLKMYSEASQTNTRVDVTFNAKTGITTINGYSKGKAGAPIVKANLTATPSGTAQTITIPTETQDLNQVITQLQAQITQSFLLLQGITENAQQNVQQLLNDSENL